MTKLTREIKQRMSKAASEYGIANRIEESEALEKKLARDCYNAVFPKKIRDALVGISDVPRV